MDAKSTPQGVIIASEFTLLNAAMRDANDITLESAVLIKARAGAISISRTLHQWVTKLEKVKKRNEAQAVEVREALREPAAEEASPPKSPAQKSPIAPVTSPRVPVPSPVAIHASVTNGQAVPAASLPGSLLSAPGVGAQNKAAIGGGSQYKAQLPAAPMGERRVTA